MYKKEESMTLTKQFLEAALMKKVQVRCQHFAFKGIEYPER